MLVREVIPLKQSTFGQYLRTMRTQNHMTQYALAEKLHVTDKAVSKWERGLSYPDISIFPNLADALGVTVGDLLQECTVETQPSRLKKIFEMSHDIRTPIHIILSCADLAKTSQNDPKQLQHYLDSIRVSGEYLLSVIDLVMQTAGSDQKDIPLKEDSVERHDLDDYIRMHLSDRGEEMKPFSLAGKKILVAEDIELNREITEEILKQTGAEVMHAENGQVCLNMIEQVPPGYFDLILMDIQMPVLDGIEATKRIRALKEREKAEIPIIAVSANVYEADRKAARQAGMDDFTEKPINVSNLLDTIHKHLKNNKPTF